MEYIIYCDESGSEGPKYSDFFGGCIINSRDVNVISEALNAKKKELALKGEIKWTKVTAQYLDRYIQIIDLFFDFIRDGKIKMRVMFRKNEDYSIESVDAMGNTSYIAVKQVKTIGDSFALSEKEYAAAQRLGEAYKVFVISLDGEKVEYLHITNPCDTLTLDKTVKEWEFICNSYDIPEQNNPDSDDTLVDERMLKYLAEDYFVSNQKAFLKDLIVAGKMAYDASLADMVEKINGVVDFYTGETLLDIRDDQITVERSKMNAIRKILGL